MDPPAAGRAIGPDVGIGPRPTRRYLALLEAGYQRTAQTVGHEQTRRTSRGPKSSSPA